MTSMETGFRVGFFIPTQNQQSDQGTDAEARSTFGIPSTMAVRTEDVDGFVYVFVNWDEWQKKQRREVILNRVRVAGVIGVMFLVTVLLLSLTK